MRLHPDKSSEIVYTSQKFLSLIGLTADDMMNDASRFERMIHPEDAYNFHAASKRAFKAQLEWHEEFRLIKPDGNEIWLESYSNHVKEPDGSILRYGILMDITNRKNLEKARKMVHVQLLESEAKYRMLADNIEAPMVVVDGEGKVVLINESAVKIFGGKQSDLIGKNLNESKVLVILNSRKLVIETVLAENRTVEDETSMDVHGQKRWFRRKFQPISINGKPSEVLITGFDITAEKTEIEIRKNYAADLEWKMKSTTDELLNELRRVKGSMN
jgi:PAS domain S-box-containing protein